jgi:hypothetical protein
MICVEKTCIHMPLGGHRLWVVELVADHVRLMRQVFNESEGASYQTAEDAARELARQYKVTIALEKHVYTQ